MQYILKRRVNYYETDKMGVVHHSNYIRFLEEARCYMLDQIQLPYSKIESLGLMIPVLNVNCNYKTHATYDDIISINCSIKDFNGVRMTISYTLTNSKTNKIIMTAETKHCFTNSSLKPCNIKKEFLNIYNTLKNISEN